MPPSAPINQKKRKSGVFPKHILSALEKCSLNTENLIYSAVTDMNDNGDFSDTFICFDDKGLYVAIGNVDVPSKKGAQPTVTVDRIETIPIEEIDEIYIEKFVSTARLIYKESGEDFPLIRFSYACLEDMDAFVYAFNSFKSGVPIEEIKAKDEPDKNEGSPKKKKRKDRGIVFRLLAFYKKYILIVLIVTLAIGAGAVFQLLVPQVGTRALFDNIISNPEHLSQLDLIKSLGILVAEIFFLKLFKVMLDSGHQFLMASITPKVVYDIKIRIFTAMQKQSVSFYTSKQTGFLMQRVTSDARHIYWFLINDLPDIIVNILMVTGIFVIMFNMSWKLSLLVLAIIPILIAVIKGSEKMFHRLHHAHWANNSTVSSIVSDNINGQRVIKAFCKEDFESKRFRKASEELRKAEVKLAKREATIFPLFQAVVHIVSTVIFAWGSILAVKGEISIGSVLSFIVYVEMIQQPINFLSGVVNRWARCMDSATRMFEIMDSQPQITEKENAVSMKDMAGSIDLSELEFEYEPARPILKNINLHVEAGEMLGIVGKTGAGKTTIASLIARLYDPKRGSVKIDGVDVCDIKLHEIHTNVGMVSQDIFLFMGTIADNIRYAKPDATMEEVIAAAKAAAAHDFIMKLPDAYETRVGSGGRDLSGGERQRISIARTIIQNPKILILDEATAAMDTQTEARIQQSISNLKDGRTTIAIAHRLSTLRDSDHLAVIDNGEIVEYGTYNELLTQQGQFYTLYKIQNQALNAIGIGE